MSIIPKKFKFIDLFAGIGGFHYAMIKYDHDAKCVFASEINKNAIKIYESNFNQSSDYDIRKINSNMIEDFDVLCAGFPCQPFSKAGKQNGFSDHRGTLFLEIERIIREKIDSGYKPKILILENVRNLESHDKGNTWKIIYKKLIELGYNTIKKPLIIKPTDFNIPQLRDRAIIVAVANEIYSGDIDFDIIRTKPTKNIFSILQRNTSKIIEEYGINDYEKKVLDAWDDFYSNVNRKIIGFPIWSDEFYLDYEIEQLPLWKQNFIKKNRELYVDNKDFINKWYVKHDVKNFKKTQRKFEWQAGKSIRSVYEGIIQFRPSGVRVKKPDFSPTLVAMAHVPIIGKYKRYITKDEARKLQSFPDSFKYKYVGEDIYRMLGNAVNVDVIYNVFSQFVNYIDSKKEV